MHLVRNEISSTVVPSTLLLHRPNKYIHCGVWIGRRVIPAHQHCTTVDNPVRCKMVPYVICHKQSGERERWWRKRSGNNKKKINSPRWIQYSIVIKSRIVRALNRLFSPFYPRIHLFNIFHLFMQHSPSPFPYANGRQQQKQQQRQQQQQR